MSIFALGIMPYISASIIMQMATHVVPPLGAAAQGRRVGSAQDHTVHALRHCRCCAPFQAIAAATALQNQGVVLNPGRQFVSRRGGHARDGHHVPDVARRADHRARRRQRHFDDHSGEHPFGAAFGDRRHARARQYRRHEPGAAVDARHPRARRYGLRRLHGARAAAHHGATTRSASKAGACMRGRRATCRSRSICRA